jgi:prevent-host-death family protein
MTQLDIREAGEKLADLIARARAGEEVIISETGKPDVRLVPVSAPEENPRRKGAGMYKGQVWIAEDFDAPLTDEELKEWGL